MEKTPSRAVAKKLSLLEINEAEFHKEEPGCLITPANEKIYRASVLGIVTRKERQGTILKFLLDDKTSTIQAIIFEENSMEEKIAVGQALLLIAKIRLFNNNKYLAPEIIKLIDPLWLKIRQQTLLKRPLLNEQKRKESSPEITSKTKKILEKTADLTDNAGDLLLPVEKILNLIKNLDGGDGVPIEEILAKSPLSETQKIIDSLLESGDLFQISPGRIKIL